MRRISIILFASFFISQAFAQQLIEKELRVDNQERLKLDFDLVDEIKINAWDKNTVYIKATVSINDDKDNDHFQLNLSAQDYLLKVESKIHDMDDISKKFIHTTKDGKQEVIHNHVEFDIAIEVFMPKEMKLDLETICGNVVINNLQSEMEVSSISGFVDLSLASSYNADLKLETITGGMYSDFDFSNKKNLKFKHFVSSKIEHRLNEGGTKIKLKSISGDIFLRKK